MSYLVTKTKLFKWLTLRKEKGNLKSLSIYNLHIMSSLSKPTSPLQSILRIWTCTWLMKIPTSSLCMRIFSFDTLYVSYKLWYHSTARLWLLEKEEKLLRRRRRRAAVVPPHVRRTGINCPRLVALHATGIDDSSLWSRKKLGTKVGTKERARVV